MPPLGRRHIYILPTRYGYLFAIMLLVMLLGSINYNNSLGYMLTFLLAGMAMVTILHTYYNLAGMVVEGGRARAAFCGAQARFELLFDNRQGRVRYSLEMARQEPQQSRSWRRRQLTRLRQQDCLPAGQLCNIALELSAHRRGLLPLGRIRLSSDFPLGLFRAWCWLDPGLTALVYPRPEGRQALPLSGELRPAGQQGRQPGSDDFIDFRPYRPGDSPRTIAWKALARGQETLVKRFSGNGGESATLDWYELERLPLEARLSQLCRWILDASKLGLRYSLILPGYQLDIAAGESHRQQCLRVLALYPGP